MTMRSTVAVATLAVAAVTACAGGSASEVGEAPAPAPDVVPAITAPGPRMVTTADVPDVPTASAGVDALAATPVPTALVVPRLGIDMPIQGVGLAPDGAMELPVSAETAGWFRVGGNPAGGVRGDLNAVMAAHVDDPVVGLGPFAALRDAREGDRVEVTLGSGETVVYQVSRVEQTSKREVDLERVFRSAEGALVLVTCGGRWDADVRHYEDNVLVWAHPLGA